MLSKNKIKFLSTLANKKARLESASFLIEGEKMIIEVINSSFNTKSIFYTERCKHLVKQLKIKPETETLEISEEEASKISNQKSPQGILALVSIPPKFYSENIPVIDNWAIALDDIQDPGNLGTIIRTADWFGIRTILCSKDTADVLNPKVLQSTMGAVFRVSVFYCDLKEALEELISRNPQLTIFAALLEGENIYKTQIPSQGILMMGNESKGLSENLIKIANFKITVPRFAWKEQSSESLNVSVATAILVSEIKRRNLK